MAVKKAIRQYKGKLSHEKIAAGMNAAARNAKRLLDVTNLVFASNAILSLVHWLFSQ